MVGIYHESIIGLRPQNEDKHDIITNLDGSNNTISSINLFAVFDGHGGKGVSKFLYDNLSKYFTNRKISYPLSMKYVNKVYNHLQKTLRIKHREFSLFSGSTCLVVIQFKHDGKDYLNVMNTGEFGWED